MTEEIGETSEMGKTSTGYGITYKGWSGNTIYCMDATG